MKWQQILIPAIAIAVGYIIIEMLVKPYVMKSSYENYFDEEIEGYTKIAA